MISRGRRGSARRARIRCGAALLLCRSFRAIYRINRRGGKWWQYKATSYMQRVIERASRVRAAMEQIERYLSTVTDRRKHSEARAEFFGLLDDLAGRAEMTARDVALEEAIKPNGGS